MHRRRQQRARASGGRKAAGEGTDVLMECEENPDYVECLVQKYMKKWRVESSTDSESDNNESFGSHLFSSDGAECLPKQVELLKLQFLDPYDGDSEETSAQSDSSAQDSLVRENDSIISLLDNSISMECAQDQRAPCNEDCVPASPEMGDSRSPGIPESLKVRSGQRTVDTSCQLNISMDSGVVTETGNPNSSHFVMIGVNPRASNSCSSVFPASLTSEENSDLGMFDTTVMKRKLGFKMENEKLRRKKARVAEPSSQS